MHRTAMTSSAATGTRSAEPLRDRLWLWAHPPGSHSINPERWKIRRPSRITPAEAALYMGIPNLIMVKYLNQPQPPYEHLALAFTPLRRVVWSILGEGGSSDDIETDAVRSLAERFPNIRGAIMDDFFLRRKRAGSAESDLAPFSPESLAQIRSQMTINDRRLDLWVVLYRKHLDLALQPWLEQCDVITFWTMQAAELADLESNFEKAERLCAGKRMMLGCYLYDYGGKQEMPLALMKKQCDLGRRWLDEGRIEGIIFLASCICDLGFEAVEWTRQWIRDNAARRLSESQPRV